MKKPLPFTALRAFEAVVRLQGFARAAEELSVTQSAISQHVKSLEEWLGILLITRSPGGAKPTTEGKKLAKSIVSGFGKVEAACTEIRETSQPNLEIVLSCLPGFAYLWLIPRLLHFEQRYPQYQISVATSTSPTSIVPDEAMAAITYGRKTARGLDAEVLFSERLFAVCSPSLLTDNPIRSIADLANHTRLIDDLTNDDSTAPTWQYWAAKQNKELPKPARELKFSQSNMVVQAAIKGLGVALGREPLVAEAIGDGRLVRPLCEVVPSEYAYQLVFPKGLANTERLKALRGWLMDEARRQPAIG